jgi:hypothetical protein
MIDYFHGASDDLLIRMGVDRAKLPPRGEWFDHAWRDHQRAEEDPQRDRFYLAWVLGGQLVGHSSINQIHWGEVPHSSRVRELRAGCQSLRNESRHLERAAEAARLTSALA